jgi:hypothetical protein
MSHSRLALLALLAILVIISPSSGQTYPPADGFNAAGSDAQAIKIADRVMQRLGGYDNWKNTRHLTWRFFSGRRHVWDKFSGDHRFENEDLLVLTNIHSKKGRVWRDGQEITQADSVASYLEKSYRAWINDSYWVVMPYKLKDSGVTLKYIGEGKTEDGTAADIVSLTFEAVGVTPQNKYHVWIGKEEPLVLQWAFYPTADTAEARFTGPWTNWQRYGQIWLSDGRGQRGHSEIGVFDKLPAAVYNNPEAVDYASLLNQ